MIWSKKMSGNFCCCKCDLKEPRDSQIPKFSQPAQPWWAGFNEGRGGGRTEGKEEGSQGGGMEREEEREREGGKERVLKLKLCTKRLRVKFMNATLIYIMKNYCP